MRNTNSAFGLAIKEKWPQAVGATSYHGIVNSLASQMLSCIRSSEAREFSGPFKLVIIGQHGGVVLDCEVGKNCKVRQLGLAQRLRSSHFPATALLTDSSLLTRTFLIEHAPHRSSRN